MFTDDLRSVTGNLGEDTGDFRAIRTLWAVWEEEKTVSFQGSFRCFFS